MQKVSIIPSAFLAISASVPDFPDRSFQPASYLHCTSCGKRCVDHAPILRPACPSCGSHTLTEIQELPFDQDWLRLLLTTTGGAAHGE